ncbi:MAG: type I-E CRISPR-associated protein Cse1/CasA [Clostridiales bacterium]|jgi:CRISPR system Cascade subunit CasA|nr:type I-E CRISPR-associated protein Cse1/CasA [Clostridiales bacterium]
MKETEFNLINERWLLISDSGGQVREYSIKEALNNADKLKALSGENPAQDVAILRLLLGILYAIFTKVDENGEEHDEDGYNAVEFWATLWNKGHFPPEIINAYLDKWQERFWLFHPERPFYQIADMDKGTSYKTPKLVGDSSESSNKIRLFQSRSGRPKAAIGNAEAARWLIYLNAFDDTSSKPTRGLKLPSVGAGWLGRLGLVYAAGNTLFQTLMLNFVLLDSGGELWEEGLATWELDSPRKAERTEIPLPQSQTELMTLQSRRICLERDKSGITGFKLLGGDFFQKENTFSEQMTLWRKPDVKKDEYVPKRHNPSKQFWRDFAPLFATIEGARRPGIVDWLAILEGEGLIRSRLVRLQAVSVQYGDKDFFVVDIWSDNIGINAALLSALGDKWIYAIIAALETTQKMVDTLRFLAANIAKASGGEGKAEREKAVEEAYFRLDNPFRIWLAEINPAEDDLGEKCGEWLDEARGIISRLGGEMVSNAGMTAFVGRDGISTPQAHLKFRNSLRRERYRNEVRDNVKSE